MIIQQIDNKQISYNGKFVLAKDLTAKEIELVNKVNNTIIDKKTNVEILRKKAYNIYVNRYKHNPELLECTTYYIDEFTKDKNKCWISFISKDEKEHKNNIHFFRNSLEWFKDYKKQHFGYNSWFDLMKENWFSKKSD